VVPWTSKISKSRLSQHRKLKKSNLSSLLKQMKTMKRKPVSSPEEFHWNSILETPSQSRNIAILCFRWPSLNTEAEISSKGQSSAAWSFLTSKMLLVTVPSNQSTYWIRQAYLSSRPWKRIRTHSTKSVKSTSFTKTRVCTKHATLIRRLSLKCQVVATCWRKKTCP